MADVLSWSEFADKVKEQHPEYSDKDNALLADAMLKKFPQYYDKVDTTGLKDAWAAANSSLAENRLQQNSGKVQTPDVVESSSSGHNVPTDVGSIDDIGVYNRELQNKKLPAPYQYIIKVGDKPLKVGDTYLNPGETIDMVKLDFNGDPQAVLEKYLYSNTYMKGEDPSKFTIEKNLSENLDELKAFANTDYGKSLGLDEEIVSNRPYETKNKLNHVDNAARSLVAKAADLSRVLPASAVSAMGTVGEPGGFLENFRKLYPQTEVPETNQAFQTPYVGAALHTANNIAQAIGRDPSFVPSLLVGYGAAKAAPYVIGGLGIARPPLVNAIKGPLIGGIAGASDVGIRHGIEKISTGQSNVEPIDYALGAVGGAALPAAVEPASKIMSYITTPMSEFMSSAPSKFNRIEFNSESPSAVSFEMHKPKQGDVPPGYILPFSMSMPHEAPLGAGDVNYQPMQEYQGKPFTLLKDLTLGRVKQPLSPKSVEDIVNRFKATAQPSLSNDANTEAAKRLQDAINTAQAAQPAAGRIETLLDLGIQKYAHAANKVVSPVNAVGGFYNKWLYPPRDWAYQGQEAVRGAVVDALNTLGTDALAYKLPLEATGVYHGIKDPYDQANQEAELKANSPIMQRYLLGKH